MVTRDVYYWLVAKGVSGPLNAMWCWMDVSGKDNDIAGFYGLFLWLESTVFKVEIGEDEEFHLSFLNLKSELLMIGIICELDLSEVFLQTIPVKKNQPVMEE